MAGHYLSAHKMTQFPSHYQQQILEPFGQIRPVQKRWGFLNKWQQAFFDDSRGYHIKKPYLGEIKYQNGLTINIKLTHLFRI